MEKLIFSYNWNNKLQTHAFTTLRLRNDPRYSIGKDFEVLLKGKSLGPHRIMAIKHLKLSEINTFISFLDTGYNPETCQNTIKKMYQAKNINWETQELSLILLVKIK